MGWKVGLGGRVDVVVVWVRAEVRGWGKGGGTRVDGMDGRCVVDGCRERGGEKRSDGHTTIMI